MAAKNKENNIVTRFAPSPTGLFHIGSARSSLFNYLFAKQNNGKFILRIENTDKERSKKEYEKDILDSHKWLGLEYDEIYRQSERTEIYKKYIQKLLDDGAAFWCYHTKEELEKEKEEQIKKKEAPRHDCGHKFKSPSFAKASEGKAKSGIIRLKGTEEKIKFNDLIRGEIEYDGNVLGDISIAKNEETPLYNFAAVIDDYEMNISHVIRGEDHIPNTPKQILIYKALGMELPKFAHLPLILGTDKSKLSKRHGATSVTDYKKDGYLPEAIINFLALLGWNPGDNREIFNTGELIKEFSFEKIQKGGAVFNTEKLNWFNEEYIKEMPTEKLAKDLLEFLPNKWKNKAKKNKEFWQKITELEKTRLTKLSDIKEGVEYLFEEPELKKEMLIPKQNDAGDTKEHLENIIKMLEQAPHNFSKENVKNSVWDYAEEKGRGNVLWPMRVALTGLLKSPDPFSVAEVLGKEETINRIKKALKSL